MFPNKLLIQLRNSRVVAGFSIENVEDAIPIAKALLAGGIDVIELTLRTDCALAAVKRLQKRSRRSVSVSVLFLLQNR